MSTNKGENQIVSDEERQRLDQMRNEKFKFIADSMANHRIDETNSEYSESIVSNQQNHRKNTRRSCSIDRQMVVEETEEDESEESKAGWHRRQYTYDKDHTEMANDLNEKSAEEYKLRQMRMMKLKRESESIEVHLDVNDDEGLEVPKIKRKSRR